MTVHVDGIGKFIMIQEVFDWYPWGQNRQWSWRKLYLFQ